MGILTDEIRKKIESYYPRYPNKQAVVLPALHAVQEQFQAVPYQAMEEIAAMLELSPAEVFDTMSFYGFFRTEDNPCGKKRFWICRSLSCMLRGGEELLHEVCDHYGIQHGQTTDDGKHTIEFVECLGVCEGAPCAILEDVCYSDLTKDKVIKILES